MPSGKGLPLKSFTSIMWIKSKGRWNPGAETEEYAWRGLASSLRAAMADDSHSGWALQLLVQVSVNESKGKGAGVYRIMAYQNAGTLTTPFSLVKLENKLTHEEQTLCTDALRDIFSDVQPLKFTTKNDLDQWIICCDPKGSLYIFAGGHLNGNQYFITTNDGGKSYTANGNGGTCNMYMIWPEPCQSYMDLASPSASEYKKN